MEGEKLGVGGTWRGEARGRVYTASRARVRLCLARERSGQGVQCDGGEEDDFHRKSIRQ